ncbi:MAG: Twitching mobility protein [Candidatus Celerinatantimonas neptuna]|nr:MAG: Twitching mobility protein [Candidatus Celerinatantimonas neptuna]
MDIFELLEFSVNHNASDLHLSAGLSPVLRIDGELRPSKFPIINNDQLRVMLESLLDQKQQLAWSQVKELDIGLSIANIGRVRANFFFHHRGCAAAFRLVSSQIPTLEKLGTPDIVSHFCQMSSGLVLVTGATGGGKSTTLAAMVEYMNTSLPRHVITIEDPIEFIYHSKQCLIHQRGVGLETLGFNQALRGALREDPDVILVGELRDYETIKLALTAAETGHLVLATLHTPSASDAVHRMIDIFPATERSFIRSLLAGSLKGVVGQKLLPAIAGGRIAAYEILCNTPAIAHLIRDDKVEQIASLMQTGSSQGMQTFEQHMRNLQQQGLISNLSVKNTLIPEMMY